MTKLKAPKKKINAGTSKDAALEKKRLFVEAMLSNNGNKRQAALAAGYSGAMADKAGQRLSKDVQVLSMLDKRQAEVLGPLKDRANRSLLETDRIAFMDPRRIVHQDGPNKGKVKTLDELDDDIAAAIASFKIDEYGRIEYKFWDKNNANERIHKRENLYKENNEGARPLTQVAVIRLVALEPLPGRAIDAAD